MFPKPKKPREYNGGRLSLNASRTRIIEFCEYIYKSSFKSTKEDREMLKKLVKLINEFERNCQDDIKQRMDVGLFGHEVEVKRKIKRRKK